MATIKTRKTFAQRTAARTADEHAWQQYHARAKFNGRSMVKSLEELAQKTFPVDAANSRGYQEAIVRSLSETISPEVGVKDFWKAMGKAKCKTLDIENGHLNFLDAKGEKIDITPYTQPIIFEAHSSFYKQRQMEREARIMMARRQLKSLLEEIHKK